MYLFYSAWCVSVVHDKQHSVQYKPRLTVGVEAISIRGLLGPLGANEAYTLTSISSIL